MKWLFLFPPMATKHRRPTRRPHSKPQRRGPKARIVRRVPGAQHADLDAYFRATGDTGIRAALATGTTQCHIWRVRYGHCIPRPALAKRIAQYAGIPIESFTLRWLRTHGAGAVRWGKSA